MRSYYFVLMVLAILMLQAAALTFFGQPLICTCHYIKLWEGNILSSGNSQHLSDWYTFTHISHGIIYYLIISYLLPRTSIKTRMLIALLIEVAWEIFENTPMAIQLYRQQALSAGYTGDSVINSICDTLAMLVGFYLASRTRWWLAIMFVIVMEIWLGYEIKDNLTLNILNGIYTFPAVKAWQVGSLEGNFFA